MADMGGEGKRCPGGRRRATKNVQDRVFMHGFLGHVSEYAGQAGYYRRSCYLSTSQEETSLAAHTSESQHHLFVPVEEASLL